MTTRPLPVQPQFKENAGSDDSPIKKKGKRKQRKHGTPKHEDGDQGEDTYDEYYEPELVEMSGGFPAKLADNVEPLNNDAAAEAAADLALSAIRSGRRNRSTPSKHHDYEKIAGPSTEGAPRRAAAKIKRMSQEVKNWKEVVVDGEQQGQVVHHEGRVPHSMSPSSNKVRKKKPKRRDRTGTTSAYEESGLDALVDEADVINTQPDKNADQTPKITSANPSIIYHEKDDGTGFIKKSALEESQIALVEQNTIIEYTTLDVSFSLQNWFHVFSLFIHGLLAGFAAWQTLQIYIEDKPDTDFLEEYSSLAWPAASAYFICTAICTVSSLDILEVAISRTRGDIMAGLFRNPIHTLTVALYVMALILTCGLSSIDDKLSLYSLESQLWSEPAKDIEMWKIINSLRMVLSVLGFLLLCYCFMFSVKPVKKVVRNTSRIVNRDNTL
ncbi:transmembrane protein 237A-like isoform X2 [Bolinopsis microptera]|uniref:transmembrane protein 237A-like isoform X2 n=1 Tax=Bolinopsis microptera TaxID=2820187 RepID=UPI00307989B9